MEMHNIVKKLIGKIEPIGDINQDKERLENLKELCSLVDRLLSDIDEIATKYEKSQVTSMRNVGEYASKFYIKLGIV